jgi:hypothetical protein
MYYPESGIVLFDRRVSSEWDHDDHAVIAPGIVHGQAWGDTLTIDLTVATTEMRTMAHDGLVHDVRILTPGADIGLNIVLCRDRTVESSLFCTIAGGQYWASHAHARHNGADVSTPMNRPRR